jgi:hypothetical protein
VATAQSSDVPTALSSQALRAQQWEDSRAVGKAYLTNQQRVVWDAEAEQVSMEIAIGRVLDEFYAIEQDHYISGSRS